MSTLDAMGNPVAVGDYIFYFYDWGTGHGRVTCVQDGEVIMRGGFMKSSNFVKVQDPDAQAP